MPAHTAKKRAQLEKKAVSKEASPSVKRAKLRKKLGK